MTKPAVIQQAEQPQTIREAIAARAASEGAWLRLADAIGAVVSDETGLRRAGYGDFAEFCEAPGGLRLSVKHASNLLRAACDMRAKFSDEEITRIGIKRALAIAPLIKNGGNAAALLAAAQSLPVKDFERELREAREAAGLTGKPGVCRVSIQATEDQAKIIRQAIERAKDEGETDSEGRALELICADYLAGV